MIKKTKSIVKDPTHYAKTRMTGTVYGKGDKSIRKSKTVTVETPRKTKTKTIRYSPVTYYGKQKKSKVVTKTRK